MPIYEWSNTWQNQPCGSAGYTCFVPVDDCGFHHVQIGRDIISAVTTAKPGYAPYTYPHPLTAGIKILQLNPPLNIREQK
jgi:hypothetical protein